MTTKAKNICAFILSVTISLEPNLNFSMIVHYLYPVHGGCKKEILTSRLLLEWTTIPIKPWLD